MQATFYLSTGSTASSLALPLAQPRCFLPFLWVRVGFRVFAWTQTQGSCGGGGGMGGTERELELENFNTQG